MEAGTGSAAVPAEVDVAVVGAGFAGLYLVYRLREEGFSLWRSTRRATSGGPGTGTATRVRAATSESMYYSFSFLPELEQEWPLVREVPHPAGDSAYLRHVADRLRPAEGLRVRGADHLGAWDEPAWRWRLRTSDDAAVSCRYFVMAAGACPCRTRPTSRAPGCSRASSTRPACGPRPGGLRGKHVAVIGTGSSGVQCMPELARQAQSVTVFQRTAQFVSGPAERRPAAGAPPSSRGIATATVRPPAVPGRDAGRADRVSGVTAPAMCAAAVRGGVAAGRDLVPRREFSDPGINPVANEVVAEMVRAKIGEIVTDPDTAEKLKPWTHAWGTKRPVGSDYYETYNRPNVSLVDLRQDPIEEITAPGSGPGRGAPARRHRVRHRVRRADRVDRAAERRGPGRRAARGRVGRRAAHLPRADGPRVPEPVHDHRSGQPRRRHQRSGGDRAARRVDRRSACALRADSHDRIEPTRWPRRAGGGNVQDVANTTLYPTADSWYMGANIPGKPRVFLPYIGGLDVYRLACQEVAEKGLMGFRLDGPAGARCNDGVIRRIQPDVAFVLDLMASLGLPPMETMNVADARAFAEATAATMPPGPAVGEITDAVLPGPGGDLAYRLYRPPTAGPHPLIAYFHGGGWVLGSQHADEPFCRDLCVRTGAVVVSVNYRHAPEDRFPAAVDDAFAAVQWIAANAARLGGVPGQLAVAG